MIGHKRIPSREGGIEIVVEELSKRLVKSGHEVVAYNRKEGRAKNGKLMKSGRQYYEGIKVVTVPTVCRKSLDAFVYSFLATMRALFGRYDVIHYHAEGPSVMLFIPHLFKIKTMVTIHGLDWQRAKWGGLARRYLLLGEKIAAKYADEVIVLSSNLQDYFLKTYHRQTQYIPNGINAAQPVEADIIKKKFGLEKNSYLLFLARIVPEKGLHYLIKAYQSIDTEIKLVAAGASSYSDEYRKEIEALAAKDARIILTGAVYGKELEELFSNCRAYILPSDIEGMPLSLLEAMSYKRKCIVSDIPENLEVTKHPELSFRKGDIASLREVLERNITDTNCGESGDAGEFMEYDLSEYDWDVIADQHARLYGGIKEGDKEEEVWRFQGQ
ncbi:MAG TPA: glycosyltransferase family 4 protein [Clostridiales bacterium]|nr:glycosyltransferase family 4 protein [Clostridiales bacterium]